MLGNIQFANPAYLWGLLFLLPLGVWYFFNRKQQQARLSISSLAGFKGTSSLWVKLYPLLFVFRILALCLIIIAAARPQTVDVSSSMLAQDLKPNRLAALKNVAGDFINQRRSDRIGLVIYAGESYTKTPITSDKRIVQNALGEIRYDGVINDGTAIGMGLATAVNRLKDSRAKSKVIILLTDGVNNSGFIDPKIAAELAVEFQIKTYTIGLGSNGNARAPIGILPNGKFQYGITKVEIDEELLQSIATDTGGLYFRATDNSSLEAIYDEINKLEKTEIEEFKYYNYQEKYRALVFLAVALLLIEWLLKNTIYRSFI